MYPCHEPNYEICVPPHTSFRADSPRHAASIWCTLVPCLWYPWYPCTRVPGYPGPQVTEPGYPG
eukprot:1269211-Rhodomonas_salina.1